MTTMTWKKTIAITGLTLLGCGAPPAYAETTAPQTEDKFPVISDTAEKRILGHMQEANLARLQGWPGMIFYCPAEEAKTLALKQICTDSYAAMEALAAQYKVEYHKARNANDVAVLPHLTGRLKVMVELTGTEPGATPAAISARVSVLAHYTGAVNRYAELNQDIQGTKHPLNVPQHVDGILWDTTTIRAGNNQDELAKPTAEAVKALMQAFFADFSKANPPAAGK